MDFLSFDIETLPNQSLPADFGFDPETVAVGNLKDPAKIEAKIAEAKEKHTKTMSLDPALCQLCTFSAIEYQDGEESGFRTIQVSGEADEHDDYEAVQFAWNYLKQAYQARLPIVSFNGLGFDLPVLFFRAIAQDVPIDKVMWNRLTRRYTNPYHYDLMQILAGWSREKWHNQDFYLKLFGIGSKNGMTGADVYPLYQAGEYDKIREYCQNDAQSLAQLFKRVAPWVMIENENEGA